MVRTQGVIRGAGWDGHRDRINIIGVVDDRIRVMYVIWAGHRDCITIIGIINDRIRVRYLDIGSTRSASSGPSGSCIGNV